MIEFIKELHQVVESLEAKKRRKSLSPSPGPTGGGTPRAAAASLQLMSSSSSHESTDDHHHHHHHQYYYCTSSGVDNQNINNTFKEIGTCCNSPVADVEAKISGSNVVLRTVSKRIPGQIVRIINVLEKFSLEILHLNISSMEDTVLLSFVVKVRLINTTFFTCPKMETKKD